MSEKRQREEKPWQPTIEKLPTFNPFGNDQNPSPDSDPAPDFDDMEEDLSEDIKPREPK